MSCYSFIQTLYSKIFITTIIITTIKIAQKKSKREKREEEREERGEREESDFPEHMRV